MDIKIADWFKALAFAVITVLAYLLIGLIVRIVLLLIFAAILAYFLNPLVNLLSRSIKRRGPAVVIAYLLFLLVLSAAVSMLVPVVSGQLRMLAADFPDYLKSARGFIQSIDRFFGRTPLRRFVNLSPEAVFAQLGGALAGQLENVVRLIPAAVGLVTNVVLVFIISLYLSLALPAMDRQIKTWVTDEDLSELYERFFAYLKYRIGRYLWGLLTLMAVVGTLIGIGLSIIGLPNAVILGVIAGLFEIIPFFGPILGAVPAVIVALTVSPITALLTVGLFVLVQLLENNTIGPVVLGKTVEVHPLAVLLVLLAGEEAAGLFGAILAVPIFVLIKSLVVFVKENFAYVSSPEGAGSIVLKPGARRSDTENSKEGR